MCRTLVEGGCCSTIERQRSHELTYVLHNSVQYVFDKNRTSTYLLKICTLTYEKFWASIFCTRTRGTWNRIDNQIRTYQNGWCTIVQSRIAYTVFFHCREKPIKTRNNGIPRISWRTIIVGAFWWFHITVFWCFGRLNNKACDQCWWNASLEWVQVTESVHINQDNLNTC